MCTFVPQKSAFCLFSVILLYSTLVQYFIITPPKEKKKRNPPHTHTHSCFFIIYFYAYGFHQERFSQASVKWGKALPYYSIVGAI